MTNQFYSISVCQLSPISVLKKTPLTSALMCVGLVLDIGALGKLLHTFRDTQCPHSLWQHGSST